FEPDAGRAVQVGVGTDEHRRAHVSLRQPATGPRPEEPNEVVLQLRRFLRGDEHVGHAAEAAGHAVDELAAVDGVGNIGGGRADPRKDFSAVGETDSGAVAGHAYDVSDGKALAAHDHRGINHRAGERVGRKIGVKSTDSHARILLSGYSNSNATTKENY